jgi:alcohol dehydrogenase
MKAWRLERLGGELSLQDIPVPEARPGSVLIRMHAAALLSYLRNYVQGKLPAYTAPKKPFTIGTNGVGEIAAVGRDVWHLKPGQRVVMSPHLVARENVADPDQVLIALTSLGPAAEPMLADWPDGTLAEYALMPAAAVTPVDGLDHIPATQLAIMMRYIVPYGGLLRGRLTVGETLVVNGATGAFGTAAVLLGVALGATRVVAAGRRLDALAAVARAGGPRVTTVGLRGDIQADARALREAAGGGAHLAFDMVGQARDPNATLAALHSLGRGGRLVLMGSMSAELPIPYTQLMFNNWEILGQFMYPADAYRRLLGLVRSELLDISALRPLEYALSDLPAAMDAAATASNFECAVMKVHN